MTTEITGTQAAGKIIRATGATTQAWVDPSFAPAAFTSTDADAGKPIVVSEDLPYAPGYASVLDPNLLIADGQPRVGQTLVRRANGRVEWGTPSLVTDRFVSIPNTNSASGVTNSAVSGSIFPDHHRYFRRFPSITAYSRLHSEASGGTSNTAVLSSQPGYTTGTQSGGPFNGRYYEAFTTPAIDNDTPGVEVRIYTSGNSSGQQLAGYSIANNASVRGWFEFSYYINEGASWVGSSTEGRGAGSSWVTIQLDSSSQSGVFSNFADLRAIAPVWGTYNSTTNDTEGPTHATRGAIDFTCSAVIPIGTSTINYQIEITSSNRFRFRYPSNSYQLKRLIGII